MKDKKGLSLIGLLVVLIIVMVLTQMILKQTTKKGVAKKSQITQTVDNARATVKNLERAAAQRAHADQQYR